jgi:hypothetical protein
VQELKLNHKELKSFFDDFSRRNQARLVSVEIFGEFGAQKEVKKMPLSGIVYESDKRDSSFLEIMFEDRRIKGGTHLTHFIPNIQNISPKKYDDGCDEALEIKDSEGNKTLLVFERLPELRAGAIYMTAGIGIW